MSSVTVKDFTRHLSAFHFPASIADAQTSQQKKNCKKGQGSNQIEELTHLEFHKHTEFTHIKYEVNIYTDMAMFFVSVDTIYWKIYF